MSYRRMCSYKQNSRRTSGAVVGCCVEHYLLDSDVMVGHGQHDVERLILPVLRFFTLCFLMQKTIHIILQQLERRLCVLGRRTMPADRR